MLASEFNDFTKPFDLHSYEACLKTIEQADYFLLLVGSRVGGWFDEGARESITQREYRTAYALARNTSLRILTFVRDDVWSHRENVKALEKHLASLHLSEIESTKITSYPNKFATDAEFVVSFIDEVARNRETALASRGQGAFPVANWVHQFKTFSEIVDVVEPLILAGMSVGEAAQKKALQSNLIQLLAGILPKINGNAVLPRTYVEKISRGITIDKGNLLGQTRVPEKTWDSMVFALTLIISARMDARSLHHALSSPLLLQYDPTQGTFRSTEAHEALSILARNIESFELVSAQFKWAEFLQLGHVSSRRNGFVTAPTTQVIGAVHLLHRWIDVAQIAGALAQGLEGQSFRMPTLMPASAISAENPRLEEERTTTDDVRNLLGLT